MKAQPTLRQLRFLVAVTTYCHFGKAAEACFVSQSTLSAAIQDLEAALGVSLLERTNRQVKATAIGASLAEQAKDILARADRFVNFAEAAGRPMSGPFYLGVIPTIAPFLLPRIMPKLRDKFPHLQIYLREEKTQVLHKQLEEGQLDGALLALPYPLGAMKTMVLTEDRFWLTCRHDHPLAHVEAITLAEIAQENILLLEDGHCLREHALAACGLEGARRNQSFKGTSLTTIVHMVANGLGITLLPQLAIEAGILKDMNLQALALSDTTPARTLALVWRPQSPRSDTMQQLGQFIRQLIK